ncbi:MAG: hypothetical protein H6627_01290 [Calditrichae bacterium]|nr:hypothetical protein [Calditrichota bacterium]MCB9057170.1 hypothetical protein [Calditrichia bacterium]
MAKKQKNKPLKNNDLNKTEEQTEFSEATEALYKKILRVMSWIVGICFVLIIILPLFENVTLDRITKVLYYIGVINLLAFTIFEFIADSFKRFLEKLITAA